MKRTSPAALRNLRPLLAALRRILPATGRVLELGSGTGEHAIAIARRFPALLVLPSDPDPEARASIAARAADAGLPNVLPPQGLDLRDPAWSARPAEAILCVNVLHVVPEPCVASLCRGAAAALPPGGPLVVAGPFARRGLALRGRLARFDAELRAVDPALGIREREALLEAGARHGLHLDLERTLPAEGDLLLVLRRRSADAPQRTSR